MDKYQTVAFERNWYSVSRPFAFQKVTMKGYVDRVVFVSGGVKSSPLIRTTCNRTQWPLTHCTTLRLWTANRGPLTMPRCTGNRSSQDASLRSARSLRNIMAP